MSAVSTSAPELIVREESDSRVAAVGLALAGALVAWVLIEGLHPVFTVPEEYHVQGLGAPDEKLQALFAATHRANQANVSLYGALLGGAMALGMAFSVAPSRRSAAQLLAAPLAGAIGGALGGFLASLIEARGGSGSGDQLLPAILVQVAWWSCLGLAIGAAYGGLNCVGRRLWMSVVGGLAAGAIVGAIYPVGMSLLMPAVDTLSVLPKEPTSRLIWLTFGAAMLGFMVPAVCQSAATPGAKAPPAARTG